MSDIAVPAVRTAARLPLPASWSARRTLQACLAVVWLLDAALQFQPRGSPRPGGGRSAR